MTAAEGTLMTRSLWRGSRRISLRARRLGRDRGFVAATLILAVGIGACTAMFSIVHAVLLRPFAVRSPERIVMLWSVDTRHQAVVGSRIRRAVTCWPDAVVRGHRARGRGQLVRNAEDRHEPGDAVVQRGLRDLLRRARGVAARARSAPKTTSLGAPVIVLSHATWTQYFGADPTVIGRKVPMNGEERRRSSRSSA